MTKKTHETLADDREIRELVNQFPLCPDICELIVNNLPKPVQHREAIIKDFQMSRGDTYKHIMWDVQYAGMRQCFQEPFTVAGVVALARRCTRTWRGSCWTPGEGWSCTYESIVLARADTRYMRSGAPSR